MAFSARWRARHRGSRSERGAAAVEFAIVLTVLLLIIFGIIDFGRLLFVSQSMKSASREGARAAVIATSSSNQVIAAIQNAGSAGAALAGAGAATTNTWAINSGAPNALTANATSGSTPCDVAGDAITVNVQVPFTWFTPALLFARNVNSVDSSTTMRCE